MGVNFDTMAFTKGQSGNPNGRKKGSKNQRSILWHELGERLTKGVNVERLLKELDELEGKDYVKAYTDLLSFFKPKLKSVEYIETPPAYDLSKLTPRQLATFEKLLEKIETPD